MSVEPARPGVGISRLVTAAFLVVILLLLGLVVASFLDPEVSSGPETTASKEERLAELEAQIQKGINLEKKLPALEREVFRLEREIDRIDATLLVIDEDDAVDRLGLVLQGLGFEVVEITPVPATDRDHVQLNVEATVRYELWMELVGDLMEAPLLVNVEELQMSRAPEGERARLRFRAVLGLQPRR